MRLVISDAIAIIVTSLLWHASIYECIFSLDNWLLLLESSHTPYINHCIVIKTALSLQWRYNERDGVSNHRRLGCSLNRLFRGVSKRKNKAPRHWPLWGEFTGDRWIPRTKGQQRGKFHLMTSSCKKQVLMGTLMPFEQHLIVLSQWFSPSGEEPERGLLICYKPPVYGNMS